MAKSKVAYTCQHCGYKNAKWLGRCPDCGEYNSLVEELQREDSGHARRSIAAKSGKPVPLPEVTAGDNPRHVVGMGEVDRVFGGGIVQGSVCLVGGDPGIGKSTLVLQVADRLASRGLNVLYVTAEESPVQIKLRAERLGVSARGILIATETNIDVIRLHLEEVKPAVAIVDSIQMVYRPELPSAPGSVSQVRECAAELTSIAKRLGISLFIIGHVTKEGAIAGPRTLEHIVDAVFYFEGERFQSYRILRGVKNRFGSTHEVGIFDMTADGLREVSNPSELFMSSDREGRVGSLIVPSMVGSRTLLVEVQALTSHKTFPTPMRRVTGLDFNRVAMIVAVLERRYGLNLRDEDVFVNAVGGAQVEEPASDLGTALAVASSFRGIAVEPRVAVMGEVGLSGEIRPIAHAALRLAEAARHGFRKMILPQDNVRGVPPVEGLEVCGVSTLEKAMEQVSLY
jgi:DNA repair protein RadA/Sms